MTDPDEIPNRRGRQTTTRSYRNNRKQKLGESREYNPRYHGKRKAGERGSSVDSNFKANGAHVITTKRTRYQQRPEQLKKDQHQAKTSKLKPATSKVAIIPSNSKVSTGNSESLPVLRWYSPYFYIPLAQEKEMIKVLLRWEGKERGMLNRQPDFRLNQIRKKCQKAGISMIQACSLRRHHMKLLNPGLPLHVLGLGADNDIRESAGEFEKAVALFLNKSKVRYKSEEEQKRIKGGSLSGGTPDFMLEEPVYISTSKNQHDPAKPNNGTTIPAIKWIEAKMFYGASTIPHDNKSAVGRILLTARKYVKHYGNGAMVFSYGCGEILAQELAEIGVIALDAHPVDLRPVEKSQRKWCGGKGGEILP